MKAGDFRICPSCQARNKPKWEYCVRCGESLQGVPLGPASTAAPDVETVDEVAGTESHVPAAAATVLGGAVLLAGMWYSLSGATARTAAKPDPGIFAIPRADPTPPPSVERPGASEPGDYQKGMLLMARKDFASALPLLAATAQREPGNAQYQNSYAKALWGAGAQEEAIQRFEVAARLAPSAGLTLDLAKALDASGQSGPAAQRYQEVLALEPGQQEALEYLGSLYTRREEHQEAARVFRELSTRRPNDVLVTQYLGQALERSGDLEGAVEAYQRVLSRMPQAAVTRGTLAEALYKQGRGEDAVTVLRDGLQRDPNAAALHRALGSVLERAGQTAEAAAAYREYARLAPNAADARQLEERAARLEQVGATPPSAS
jgi:predicted Zn-dependent protease